MLGIVDERGLHPAAAGAVAASVWSLLEPIDQRLLRCDYSDVLLLGKSFTRGRLAWPVGFAIHAANGAVAAKIRQFGPSLASELSNKDAKVTQIEVRVQARNPSPPSLPHQRPALPGLRQKQGLTTLAHDLPEESPLKDALERLLRSIKE